MLSIFNRLAFFAASAESVTEPVTEALPNNPIVVEPLPFLPRAFAEFITDGLFGEITKDIALKDYSTWHYVVMVLMYLSIIIIPYLLGSLNFAVVVSKRMYGEDIREFGSGNAGLTNMYRIYGKKAQALPFWATPLRQCSR